MPRKGNALVDFRLPRVSAARYVRDHVVWLRFDDGLEGELDLGDGLRGALMEPLRDTAMFAQLSVEYGTITWPNGADWDPDTLHDRLRASKGLAVHSSDDVHGEHAAIVSRMPEISRFYGVVIRMLANDHAPPHFHAEYGEYAVAVTIRDAGRFPGRALRLVLEWRELHQDQLLANWDRLRRSEPPQPIEPLS
jgi:hypothetical protein